MTFSEKLKLWFDKFSQMKPGQCMEVAHVGKKDPALFIDVCKEFIDQDHPEYSFSNDYKFFRRNNSWPV